MRIKKYIILSALALTLTPIVTSEVTNTHILAKETATTQNSQIEYSYEESLKLPSANFKNDLITNQERSITTYSTSNPSSINDYKKLGYKNIKYTGWNTVKMISSKQKAVAKVVASTLVGLLPGKSITALTTAFSLGEALKSPEAYVWPTSTVRNILATSPRGTEVIIGQEVYIKYYSNSSRTKLIKTVHKTFWVG